MVGQKLTLERSVEDEIDPQVSASSGLGVRARPRFHSCHFQDKPGTCSGEAGYPNDYCHFKLWKPARFALQGKVVFYKNQATGSSKGKWRRRSTSLTSACVSITLHMPSRRGGCLNADLGSVLWEGHVHRLCSRASAPRAETRGRALGWVCSPCSLTWA